MSQKSRKNNSSLDFFNARIDAIRMSDHERLKAKARFARAEAMAELLARIAGGIGRLLKAAVVRPYRLLVANHG